MWSRPSWSRLRQRSSRSPRSFRRAAPDDRGRKSGGARGSGDRSTAAYLGHHHRILLKTECSVSRAGLPAEHQSRIRAANRCTGEGVSRSSNKEQVGVDVPRDKAFPQTTGGLSSRLRRAIHRVRRSLRMRPGQFVVERQRPSRRLLGVKPEQASDGGFGEERAKPTHGT